MVAMVLRASTIACSTPARSLRISVTDAASAAMSVPDAIAMPTSACASAGASLRPSPIIATACPPCCSELDRVDLAVRQHLGDHLVDADLAARSASRWPCDRRSASRPAGPRRLQRGDDLARVRRAACRRSQRRPPACAVDRGEHHRARVGGPLRRAVADAPRYRSAIRRSSASVPTMTRWPSTPAITPLPASAWKSLTSMGAG